MQRKSRNFKNFSDGFVDFEFEGGNKVNKYGKIRIGRKNFFIEC